MSFDTGFEVDDGNGQWCENCLDMSDEALAQLGEPAEGVVIVFDEASGRHLCVPCKSYGREG